MSSTSQQTPVQIKPDTATAPVLASAPAPTKSTSNVNCPPGQIKDSQGNCVTPSTFVQNLKNNIPKTPPVLAAAPAPTVQTPSGPVPVTTPSAPPASPRSDLKTPKANTHVQQTAAGGANPPTLTPPPVPSGAPSSPTSTPSNPPPTTPTIPPAQIPPPTNIPPKPIPPTQVPPRQTPPPPPVPHVNVDVRIDIDVHRQPGDFRRFFPVCTSERFPDRFRRFDHRFFDIRVRLNCHDFREEFDDDDDDRFRPFILRMGGRVNVALVLYILGLQFDPSIAGLGRDIPTGAGIWVLATDGEWYRVNQADLDLINQIESTRQIDRHQPIILGGGAISLQSGNREFSIQGLAVVAIGLGIIWWLTGGKRK